MVLWLANRWPVELCSIHRCRGRPSPRCGVGWCRNVVCAVVIDMSVAVISSPMAMVNSLAAVIDSKADSSRLDGRESPGQEVPYHSWIDWPGITQMRHGALCLSLCWMAESAVFHGENAVGTVRVRRRRAEEVCVCVSQAYAGPSICRVPPCGCPGCAFVWPRVTEALDRNRARWNALPGGHRPPSAGQWGPADG